jgi:hypothetical protein
MKKKAGESGGCDVVATQRMNSLELAVLEPYENGELKPHTVGIIRDIEAQNEQYEVEDKFERKELRRSLEIRLVKKFDKSPSLLFSSFPLSSLSLTHFV